MPQDRINPLSLRPHYSAFVRPERILLTGHSHQAWPDAAQAGLLEGFSDAALYVDDKWQKALQCAEEIRLAVAGRIGAQAEQIALGQNTHELVVRFLSSLPLDKRPHLITTQGEFHSMHRQLQRLSEAGLSVSWVPTEPVPTLAERLAKELRPTTAAVLVSTVLFETGAIVPHLDQLAGACQGQETALLLDAYHGFGVVPFALSDFGQGPVFVVAGGYKYAQWGEGCCWMRVPPDYLGRPLYTGWFSDFAHLQEPRSFGPVQYGPTSALRFAGSTYDPISHYRARAVVRFFDEQGLTIPRLRALSLYQTAQLFSGLQGFEILTPRESERRGGFVALRHPKAAALTEQLRAQGVNVDSRGTTLRLGPALYTTDEELDKALRLVRQLVSQH